MNNTEFYDRLGVSKDASQDEMCAISEAFKKYHPDINKDPRRINIRKFKRLMKLLSDPQKRTAYDQYGPAGANGDFGGGAGGFGGFDGALVSAVLKISSQASLVEAVQAVILMHLVKGMICSM